MRKPTFEDCVQCFLFAVILAGLVALASMIF